MSGELLTRLLLPDKDIGHVPGSDVDLTPSLTTVLLQTWNQTDRWNETEDIGPTPVAPVAAPMPELSRELRISLYAVIFFLSVAGNALVIITLVQNKRMRTVTNVFLLNLAVSDLLLGVFCMPFTLVGTLLREFVFGEAMCKTIPYLQAVSVSVSVWTLVAISLERYFAICQPLRSRRWQTLSHSYKMIAAVWMGSFVCMTPIAVLSQLLPMSSGRFKCREDWPDLVLEKVFNIFLDGLLLVIPLVIMVAAYAKISFCLWKGIQIERHGRQATAVNNCLYDGHKSTRNGVKKPQVFCFREANRVNIQCNPTVVVEEVADPPGVMTRRSNSYSSDDTSPPTDQPPTQSRSRVPARSIRSSNYDKSLAAKKHVIRMLVFVVLEFFICWTPLYVINTVSLFDPWSVYGGLGYTGISFFQLLAYISSCCNPITYCFLNRKFRQAFLQVFGCRKRVFRRGTQTSTNGMSFYQRRSTIRTVVEDRESETAL